MSDNHDLPSEPGIPVAAVSGSAHERCVRARLSETGRWGAEPFASIVDRHASLRPRQLSFVSETACMDWATYAETSGAFARVLQELGLGLGDHVAIWLPDGPAVHAAFVGCEKAGTVTVGVGPRAGLRELTHLLKISASSALVTLSSHRGQDTTALFSMLRESVPTLRHHIIVENPRILRVQGVTGSAAQVPDKPSRPLRVDEPFLLNSTSGTTGMPKCVCHHQNRWLYFHAVAVEAGRLSTDDVFMSLLPAPFGFGIWTAHVTPLLLGCPTVVTERFAPDRAIDLMHEHGVTVVSCVSTQLLMMLNSGGLLNAPKSLRVMFTGGEAVPFQRAREFERLTGAVVLQFYGSNETGLVSRTTLSDPDSRRLTTAGRVVPAMNVRVFDDAGRDVCGTGLPGQPACDGPATCLGYYGDDEANDALFAQDGSMLMGDIVTVDADGYLTVVGRKTDFIIRGGKNISSAAVEEAVRAHPSVALAAVVGVPDQVFGERVCACVVLHPGQHMDLPALAAWLDAGGISRELFPERLLVMDELPLASGGKVAKGDLRPWVLERLSGMTSD